MLRRHGIIAAIVAVACSSPRLVLAEDGAAVREFRAECWLNNPVFRLHDKRVVVVYVFDSSARTDRKTARAIRLLNRLALRPDTVVIGLTASPCQAAQRFVRRNRIRFTVGAGSSTAKKLASDGLPRVFRIDRSRTGAVQPTPMDADQLAALLPVWKDYTSSDVRQLNEPWQLAEVARSSAPYKVRVTAVERLYELSDPQAFVQTAETLLANEPNPWVRSWLEYYRDLASGVDRPGLEQRTPSTAAWLDYRADPDAPQWQAVRTFRQQFRRSHSARLLLDALRDHAGDSPADLVIRRLAAQELVDLASDNKQQVRSRLMEWLPSEPDPSVRMYLAFALSYACEPGDTQAAQLLRDLAAVETRILLVRPRLEYLARVIETGEEDPDRLFVRKDD